MSKTGWTCKNLNFRSPRAFPEGRKKADDGFLRVLSFIFIVTISGLTTTATAVAVDILLWIDGPADLMINLFSNEKCCKTNNTYCYKSLPHGEFHSLHLFINGLFTLTFCCCNIFIIPIVSIIRSARVFSAVQLLNNLTRATLEMGKFHQWMTLVRVG